MSDDFTDDLLNMGFTKGYTKGIDECIAILIDDSCVKTCPYAIPNCTKCMKKRLEALKEQKNE